MDAKILREEKNILKQRLRILILQNAREGEVYDDKFLMELHHISKELLALQQKTATQGQVIQASDAQDKISLLYVRHNSMP